MVSSHLARIVMMATMITAMAAHIYAKRSLVGFAKRQTVTRLVLRYVTMASSPVRLIART